MTDRQVFAISNVTINLEDLGGLGKFARTLTRGVTKFGTILTVDRQGNEYSWHVCVSLLDSNGLPTPLEQLSETGMAVILDLARELLGDVGRPDSDVIHNKTKSVHIVRPVTSEEERQARSER
jgi:hypothetical protein